MGPNLTPTICAGYPSIVPESKNPLPHVILRLAYGLIIFADIATLFAPAYGVSPLICAMFIAAIFAYCLYAIGLCAEAPTFSAFFNYAASVQLMTLGALVACVFAWPGYSQGSPQMLSLARGAMLAFWPTAVAVVLINDYRTQRRHLNANRP